MSRVPALAIRTRRRLSVVTTVTATTLATVLGVPAAAVADEDTGADRVLQSVSLGMSSDGTLTRVDSTVVRTDGGAEDAETSEEAYAPTEVVGDLPVRVLTAYRTADGAGTDLSDLDGYTGRVAIDLTVQNLTVRPRMIAYDVAGSSRQQAALVGSPLTITASTDLGDLKPSRIVTDDEGTGTNVTNGVLGQSADGTTVQWAALLAPPTLSSSAELSLVVDAKNFEVPSFDLSVQPGLVTDPSIGALVDSAFNPADSSELDLQRRTIDLIGQVNDVLARASSTITDVRTSLNDSAATLGTQTVADLQSSTQSVTSNMRSLDGALQALRQDLGSTLDATGSSAIAELAQAAAAVDKLLGDTSGEPPPATVGGAGCDTTVEKPKQADSVYGNLLQVASQLDGYAKATEACKGQLQTSIIATIGPDFEHTATECTAASTSVTCSLRQTQQKFDAAAETLRSDMKDALGLLQPDLYNNAVTAADALVEVAYGDPAITDPNDPAGWGIQDITDRLDDRRAAMYQALAHGWRTLDDEVIPRLDTIAENLNRVDFEATSVRAQLVSMKSQTVAAATEVCRLVEAETLTEDEARKTLSYLMADPTCIDGRPLSPTDTGEDGALLYPAPMVDRIDDQIAALDRGLEASDTAVATVQQTRTKVQDLSEALKQVTRYTDPNSNPGMLQLLDLLGDKFGDLKTQSENLKTEIRYIQALSDKAAEIEDSIDEAVDAAKGQLAEGVAEGTQNVVVSGNAASQQLGTMFQTSVEGLKGASDTVVKNGRKSINQQKSEFAGAQKQAGNRITDTIEKGLAQINSGVSASTRDMEAANTLLTADLRKVLLDLGERRVGGGGLLGAMSTNAATARSADYQLALASDTTTAYANVRDRDIAGIMLQQAQTDAAMRLLAELPAFQLDLPAGSQHRTVYSFSIGGGQ